MILERVRTSPLITISLILFAGFFVVLLVLGQCSFSSIRATPDELYGSSALPADLQIHRLYKTENGDIGEFVDTLSGFSLSVVRSTSPCSQCGDSESFFSALKTLQKSTPAAQPIDSWLINYAASHFDIRRARDFKKNDLVLSQETVNSISFRTKHMSFFELIYFSNEQSEHLILAMQKDKAVDSVRLAKLLQQFPNLEQSP